MIVDAHHHLWKVSRGDYHWMTPDMTVLARDYLIEDLQPHLERHRSRARCSFRPPRPRQKPTFCSNWRPNQTSLPA